MLARDILIAILAAGLLLAVGIAIGRNVERVDAVRAESREPRAEKIVISKNEAWERCYPPRGSRLAARRSPAEDLRVPRGAR